MASVNTTLTTVWNAAANCWVCDIANSDGVPILQGVPLVCGADLLEQFGYLELGGQMLAQTDHATDVPPTYSNLGIAGHLYYLGTPVT